MSTSQPLDCNLPSNYFPCEHVESWHVTLSILLFLFTLIICFLVFANSVLIWNFSYYNSLRFRCPTLIFVWSILTEIYLLSRLLYGGILFKWWSNTPSLDIFTYTIRGFGLNGGIFILLIRAWMYYVLYKYDQDILHNTKSFISKYSILSSEKYLLKIGIIILSLLTVILGICRYYDIDNFSDIYYAITFIAAISILILIPTAHDQLGIRIEYGVFLLLYIFGFIGVTIISLQLSDTSKRLTTWAGSLCLLFIGNAFTFYFPFIRGGLLRMIRKGDNHINKQQKIENQKELALILSSKRSYEAFRHFLASIFCVENVDFFVAVAHYRYELNQNELKLKLKLNNIEQHPHSHDTANTANTMIEKIANKVFTSPRKDKQRTRLTNSVSQTISTNTTNTNTNTVPAPYIKAISITNEQDIVINQNIGSLVTLPDDPDESLSTLNDNDMDDNKFIEQDNDNDETDTVLNLTKNESNQSDNLAVKKSKHKKAKRSRELFADLTHIKTAEDIINDLTVNRDGKKVIDIQSLKCKFIEYRKELKGLDINDWPQWIYDHYISNNAECVINVSYNLRLSIQQYFEPHKYGKPVTDTDTDINTNNHDHDRLDTLSIINDTSGSTDMSSSSSLTRNIFDDAQGEIWKLMTNDSLTHFKRTDAYKQINAFYSTVSPDAVDAKPKFALGISTPKAGTGTGD